MKSVVTIEGLAGGGRGVAKPDGQVWLVSGALPGEIVEAEVSRSRAGIHEATALACLDSPHPAREGQPCPHAQRCGGCDWPHVRPEAGASLKRAVAAGAARTHPELAQRLASAPVTPSAASYRLRSRLHWDPANGRLGFYRRYSWDVTAIDGCRLISPRLTASLDRLAEILGPTAPEPVDLDWLEDLDGSEAVVALRPARGGPSELPQQWLPTPAAARDLVDGWHLLARSGAQLCGWGADGVTMALPVPLRVPIGSFFQVNRHLALDLFVTVARRVGPGSEPVWDLHGGVGLLAAAASSTGKRPVTLVEPFRPAARAAEQNLPAARVVVGRTAEAYLSRHRRLAPRAIAITDPPRVGMTPRLRNQLSGWHPSRLVTMACDPATWARDAAFFLERGYGLTDLELFDLFPHTSHVELLAQLETE
jgi:23S rRNA (uracil1939-C5)-methyltransferase